VTELIHRPDDLDTLRARAGELETGLDARRAGLAQVKTELADFRLRYRREVGLLHDELEDLERGIAELELGEFAKRLDEEGRTDNATATDAPMREQPARGLTSDAVRRLFRDVAKAIHPDRASDEDRDRRHALMVEANRA
jgi:hypothetical protein